MRIREILDPRHIILDLKGSTKRAILEELSRPVAQSRVAGRAQLEARLKAKGTLDPVEKLTPELLGEMYEKRASAVDVGGILRDVQGFMTEELEKKSSLSWTNELFLMQKDKLVDSAKRYLLADRS